MTHSDRQLCVIPLSNALCCPMFSSLSLYVIVLASLHVTTAIRNVNLNSMNAIKIATKKGGNTKPHETHSFIQLLVPWTTYNECMLLPCFLPLRLVYFVPVVLQYLPTHTTVTYSNYVRRRYEITLMDSIPIRWHVDAHLIDHDMNHNHYMRNDRNMNTAKND